MRYPLLGRQRFHGVLLAILFSPFSLNSHLVQAEDADSEPSPFFSDMDDGNGLVMVIRGSRHGQQDALFTTYVSAEDSIIPPTSLTQMLAYEPGLNINGQPGLFQTISVRGLGRQRVLTFVDGMRITSERRAGVAASFIDPLLLSGVEVVQGPASTYYGSGALGGTLQMVTRDDINPWAHVGYGSDGNEYALAAGMGDEVQSFAAAYRHRNNGETIEGEEKNNRFRQHSLYYKRHIALNEYDLDVQLLHSKTSDIGKDNLRFLNGRITDYPQENHLLLQTTLSTGNDWLLRAYAHKQDLSTEELRVEKSLNQVQTDSLDVGLSFEDRWNWQDWSGLYGADYFGRIKVESQESQTDVQNNSFDSFFALQDARENEYAVFATVRRHFDNLILNAGVRTNFQSQNSKQSDSVSDQFTTYFGGFKTDRDGLNLAVNYGTGFRFASLSERLFSGTTGRGQTVGNPNLQPETSKTLDVSIDYQSGDMQFSVHRFRSNISNFIQRISIGDDTRSYQNLTKGTIDGWQYQVQYAATDNLTLVFDGHGIHGEDANNQPLADIPPKRHQVKMDYQYQDWSAQLAYAYRLAKPEAADGEIPLASARIVRLNLGYSPQENWQLNLSVSNALDETYYASSDDLSTLATGRQIFVSLSYR